jgi:DNA-binding ferritin-like protein (Dps family)
MPEIIVRLRAAIAGKKKWRAHVARVKALPKDYQIVYQEIQNYLFKVGPVELSDGMDLLAGIVDLFEEGAAAGKSVLAVTGNDVAAFCDDLVQDSKTYADSVQASVDRDVRRAVKKTMGKTR